MHERLRTFTRAVEKAVDAGGDEAVVLDAVARAMTTLVEHDDWLPDEFAQPHPTYYRQFLLHRDPASRFSIVSFVWGPGQTTPIHDHLTWGVIGMMRGAERCQSYRVGSDGLAIEGDEETLEVGDVATVSPGTLDIHRVSNAYGDRVSISIHAYGTDIGRQRRHVFDPVTGAAKEFVSGYSNEAVAG